MLNEEATIYQISDENKIQGGIKMKRYEYGNPFVSIVMGASTKELLYQEMTSLLEHINTV